MAARKTSTTTEQPANLAELYDSMEATMKDMTTKEFGKYLTWKFYRDDIAEIIKFLCSKHENGVPTAMVRQMVVGLLTRKISNLPEGGEKVFDEVNRIRVEVTKTELKERLTARLEASVKSTNNGPTITRNLGMPSNRAWLTKTHGVKFENGLWTVVKPVEMVEQKPQEDNSS